MTPTGARRIGVVVIWLLLFAEHMAYGATADAVGLLAALAHCVACLALLWTIDGRGRLHMLRWPGLAFAAAMIVAAATTLAVPAAWANSYWHLTGSPVESISLDPVATRIGIIRFIGYAALVVTGALLADDDLHPVIIGMPLLLGTLYAIWAIAAFRVNPAIILGVERTPLGPRLSGSFLSPNTAGTLFAMLTAMAALRLVALRRRLRLWRGMTKFEAVEPFLLLVALGLSVRTLLMTASRGAMIALLLSLAVIAIVSSYRMAAAGRRLVPIAVATIILGGMLVIVPLVATRWWLWAGSWASRSEAFDAFFRLIRASPWFGYGIGTFEWQNNLAMTEQNAVALSWIGAVHNFYIQLIAEQGLLGGGLLLLALALLFGRIGAALLRRRSAPLFLTPVFAALLIVAIHGLSDFALQIPSIVAMTAFLVGLGIGASQSPSRAARTMRAGQLQQN